MENLTRKEKKALKVLYEAAEQTLDRGSYGKGGWPELEDAMRTVGPYVYKGYKGITIFWEDNDA